MEVPQSRVAKPAWGMRFAWLLLALAATSLRLNLLTIAAADEPACAVTRNGSGSCR